MDNNRMANYFIKILTLLFFLISGTYALGQLPTNPTPTQFSTGYFKQGWHRADSGHISAVRDTNFTPRFPGTRIMWQRPGIDTSEWFYTGQRFIRLLRVGDVTATTWGSITGTLSNQTDLQNALNLKLNIVDTANQWWPRIKRFVDTMYRVNDSTVGYTILGNPYTFQIKGGVSASAVWGSITGILSNQTDLQNALNLKLNISDSAAMLSPYLRSVTNATLGLPIISKVGQSVKGKGILAGDGISIFNRGDTVIEFSVPLAQDYSEYRFPPDIRWVLHPTLTSDGRDAYTMVKVSPSSASSSYMPGTNDTLIITTYDGNPSVAHPSIVYIDSGWHGYKWWMAFTPYPAEARENPSILASNDFVTWVVPPGTTNPVVGPPAAGNYYSDVELVYRGDQSRMYLFYRYETVAGVSQHLYKICDDGSNWINETIFISSNAGASPAIVYKDSVWHMWDIDYTTNAATQDPFYLIYRTSPSLQGFELAKRYVCQLTNTPSGKHIWHIEVRWNREQDQFYGIFDYTTINPGGAPNNGGVLAYATSTSTTSWNVRDVIFPIGDGSQYRASFDTSTEATRNGAIAQGAYNPQWTFHPFYLWVKPRTTVPTISNNYDTVLPALQAVYEFRYRLTQHWSYPVAQVRRSSDDSLIHVFPGENNRDLIIRNGSDSIPLNTFAGTDTLYLVRLYNQVSTTGDYLDFREPGQPRLVDSIWNGTTAWGWIDDGTDDYGESYKAMALRGIMAAASLDTGKLFSRKNSVQYIGLNGTNLTLLGSGSISTPNVPSPQIRTGIYNGSSSKLRVNGVEMASGTTTNPPATGLYQAGVFYNGTSYQDYHKGRYAGLVAFDTVPSAGAITNMENVMLSEYAYDADSTLFDNYTDVNGTLVTAHIPNLAPVGSSYSATDALFEIQSNALTRSAAGSGSPLAVINSGQANGYVQGTIDPGAGGASGLVFRHTDANNYFHVRVFGGTALAVFRTQGGTTTQIGSATVAAGSSYTIRVELWGSRIRVFFEGATTPNITVTDSFNTTATNVGWLAPPADFPAIFDNLQVIPFINYL